MSYLHEDETALKKTLCGLLVAGIEVCTSGHIPLQWHPWGEPTGERHCCRKQAPPASSWLLSKSRKPQIK